MEFCVLKYSLHYEEHQNKLFSYNCDNEMPLNHFIQGEKISIESYFGKLGKISYGYWLNSEKKTV